MPASPDDQVLTMIANLEANTGVAWSEWLDRARAAGTEKHGEIVKHLKTTHGIGHGYANLVAHKLKEAVAGGPVGEDDLVTAQYAGKKAGLRPIHDAVVAAAKQLGTDVEIAPKKTCVSLRRKKQFALVQPSTATRVDLGINLKGTAPAGRLEASGSFNAMVSHRVRLASAQDIDAEVIAWLAAAYEQAG